MSKKQPPTEDLLEFIIESIGALRDYNIISTESKEKIGKVYTDIFKDFDVLSNALSLNIAYTTDRYVEFLWTLVGKEVLVAINSTTLKAYVIIDYAQGILKRYEVEMDLNTQKSLQKLGEIMSTPHVLKYDLT